MSEDCCEDNQCCPPVSSLSARLKNLARSKEDRALYEEGFVDECGDMTYQGKDALLATLFGDYKEVLSELALQLQSERKDKKKK